MEKDNIPQIDKVLLEDERRHLESLLKDRIHFHLVFASVLLVGSERLSDPLKWYALLAGTLVSFLIALAVLRTHRLVQKVLSMIRRTQASHPYTVFYREVWFPPNANYLLVVVPFIITGLFALLAIIGPTYYSTTSTQAPASTPAPTPQGGRTMAALHWLATLWGSLFDHYKLPLVFFLLIISIVALSLRINDTISKIEKYKKDKSTK